MKQRKVKARCYFCLNDPPKRAKFPAENPRWCSLRCAANWAASMAEGDGLEWDGFEWVDPECDFSD